jgi:coenzyme F420-0:L-glutamate ligase/coenzyme F420-1:gamma-L-glutamate ligase
MPPRIVLSALPDIPIVKPGDDLATLILESLERAALQLTEGDILVVTQKIVSKAEGRLIHLSTVEPSAEAHLLAKESGKDPRLAELILRESRRVLRTRPGLVIVEHRLGFVCANGGIDRSNVRGEGKDPDGWVLLLPENPDGSAQLLRDRIRARTSADVGILIIDSHGRAWRQGTVGVAIGLAGMPGLLDLRGTADLFGYRLQATEVAVADELAAACSLLMGQAAEGTPVVHVRGVRFDRREGSLRDLLRPADQDLFR